MRCDNCGCQPVCSIYRATGGVKSCEHHKEERQCDWCKPGKEVCGTCRKFFDYYGDGGSDRCSAGFDDDKCDYYEPIGNCPNCGADMRGMPSSGHAGHLPSGEGFDGVDTDPSGAIRRTETEVDNE